MVSFEMLRTNCFMVKDEKAFLAWLSLIPNFEGVRTEDGTVLWVKRLVLDLERHPDPDWVEMRCLVRPPGVGYQIQGTIDIPTERRSKKAGSDKMVRFDFLTELSSHLVPEEIALVQHIECEGFDYFEVQCFAITAEGIENGIHCTSDIIPVLRDDAFYAPFTL